jgi:hypothetical protein
VNHEIYIFGSAVRGEVSSSSDIDVLVIPFDASDRDYPGTWSVYSPEIIESYFRAGRLFAWHLHLEAKCIFSSHHEQYLRRLGAPASYTSAHDDIDHLEKMLRESVSEIRKGTNSLIYEVGIAYTAIRDIAMAASWKLLGKPCFSRDAPYVLPIACPLPRIAYRGAMLSRHSSTRGSNLHIDAESVARGILEAPILDWVKEVRNAI